MSEKNVFGELASRLPQLASTAGDRAERLERAERMKRASEDFPYFCSYYLHDYFSCAPAEYQKILYDIVRDKRITAEQTARLHSMMPADFRIHTRAMDDISLILDIEPREHGKSVRWTFAYPLWRLMFGHSHFAIIIGANGDEAMAQLDSIKSTIETNDRVIDDFGDLKGKTWKADNLTLSNGGTIRAYGKGAAIRGARKEQYRPDLIIVDDMMKDNEAESSKARDKLWKWFNRTVLPLGKDAFFIVVNTITNEDDVPSRLLKKAEGSVDGWLALRFDAVKPDDTPLWPERYSREYFARKEKELGSISYAQEYRNRPMSDEDRIIKRQWILRCKAAEIPQKLRIYAGIDPATGANDQSALVRVGLDRSTGMRYVIYAHGEKESTEQFKRRIINSYRVYRDRRLVMEDVAFQKVYKNEITRDAAKEGLALPMRGARPGRASKSMRLLKNQPYIENGLVMFGPGTEDLIDNLLAFPTAPHDDLVDAFNYAMDASEKGGGFPNGGDDDPMAGRNWKKEMNL